MRYGSVCSGIEAATSAWHPLGWTPQWFSEIEPFPSAVLAHHYPTVPNFGDMTNFKNWTLDDSTAIDVLVGGTPCQSFSVAGLRKGLDDPRGNLMLTYLAIANKYRPKWLVWENVPGVLSSNGGNDFASLLRGMGELGYGFAYRIFDAQHFGVPQRRRRVFLIGCLGDWRAAAAVLFERHSMLRNSAPCRKTTKSAPAFFESSLAQYRQADVGGTLKASGGVLGGGSETFLAAPVALNFSSTSEAIPIHDQATRHAGKHGDKQDGKGNGLGIGAPGEPMNTMTKGDRHAVAQPIPLDLRNATRDPEKHDEVNRQGIGVGESGDPAHTLTSACVHGVAQAIAFSGQMSSPQVDFNLSSTLQAKNPMAVAYAFDSLSSNSMKSSNPNSGVNQVDVSKTLDTSRGLDPSCNQGGIGVVQSVSACDVADTLTVGANQTTSFISDMVAQQIVAPTLTAANNPSRSPQSSEVTNQVNAVYQSSMAVRRLTPVECERLQGFVDGHTNIPWRNKPESPDGPRYKALGNSMAVPVMAWIGQRIQLVEDIHTNLKA